MPDDLSVGFLQAVSLSEAKEVGPALVGLAPTLPSVPRAAAVKTLLARAAWVEALLAAAEAGQFDLGSLALDQKQRLAAHADDKIAERAKKLLASGGGLPDANRQQVIAELSPKVLTGGDPQRGQQVFVAQCGKCHVHSGAGGKVGPDLTGMAVHPREELLVQILDPSRSVEGNFLQYTAVIDDGRSLVGLLASRTKTSIELVDAEGKRHALPARERRPTRGQPQIADARGI